MLRFTMAILLAMLASGTAMGTERSVARQDLHHRAHRTAVILPAGLPRPHYKFEPPFRMARETPIKGLTFVLSMAMNPTSCSRLHTPTSGSSRL